MSFEKNPNPTKDQHFMVDHNMLRTIYDTADIKEKEHILEIGGGSGALTDYLIQGNNYVTVIEKDPYYASLLKEKYKDYKNVTLIEGDALDFNYNDYDRIVANLPYTITEPFLVNLAISGALNYNPKDPNSSKLKSVTLVVSQNSTRKMVAPVQITDGNSKHYNSEFGLISVICKAFCDIDIISAIPSSSFYPEPAVTSFVVNMTPKKNKTTVDRILREMLIDKKGIKPTIQRIYQLMLSQEKIYKPSKHKKNLSITTSSAFTSGSILTRNIYDLTNAQLSQLVQDLIRNDINIKSRNSSKDKNNGLKTIDDINQFFINGRFIPLEEDLEDDYSEEIFQVSKRKFEKKYDYMYETIRYNVLMYRGLEFLEPEVLRSYLINSEIDKEKLSSEQLLLLRKK